MRKRRPGRRFFQESWPVDFKGFPASAGDQSNQEEDDDTFLAAADFTTIKSCRGVPDSSRTANRPR